MAIRTWQGDVTAVAHVWTGEIGTTTNGHTYILTLTDEYSKTHAFTHTVSGSPASTAVVATSFVKSTTKTNDSEFQKALKTFKISNSLDESALGAWQLAKTLREGRVPFQHDRRAVAQRNFEAYVYHDHYRSIVTIGSFDSPNDPRIAEFRRIFGAKVKSNPNTGKDVLIAEVMTLPDLRKRNAPLKTWIFDPNPQLIDVPKLR